MTSNHLYLCFVLYPFLWSLLLDMDSNDVSIWSSRFVGSSDNFSLMNASKSNPLLLLLLFSASDESSLLSFTSILFSGDSSVFPNGSCSKFKILFMLSSAGSMISKNPFTHVASSTTSVRCYMNHIIELIIARLDHKLCYKMSNQRLSGLESIEE